MTQRAQAGTEAASKGGGRHRGFWRSTEGIRRSADPSDQTMPPGFRERRRSLGGTWQQTNVRPSSAIEELGALGDTTDRRSSTVFTTLEEWLGRVDEVGEDTFSGVLWNADDPEDEEWAEFDIAQVAPDDRGRLRPGAGFYWTVGYRDEPDGERLAVSVVRMQRFPVESPKFMEASDAEADVRAPELLDRDAKASEDVPDAP
ncbi:hypothetical protein [Baekduia sp. Peel2402]|uniref:hypothetical protein n=1 Tax=Baekduia sp. Peel2402 TaxID=3458296 RepID=UPI00403E6174